MRNNSSSLFSFSRLHLHAHEDFTLQGFELWSRFYFMPEQTDKISRIHPHTQERKQLQIFGQNLDFTSHQLQLLYSLEKDTL